MLGARRPAPPGTEFLLCDTPKRIEWLFRSLRDANRYAWDVETTSPTARGDDEEVVNTSHDEKIVGISFCWSSRVAAYLPLYANKEGDIRLFRRDAFDRVVADLKREMEDPSKERETWNGLFDEVQMHRCFDIHVPEDGADWMLAHHLLDENRLESTHRLKDCMATYVDPMATVYEQDLQKALDQYDPNLRRYSMVPLETIYPYGCADAWGTWSLGRLFEPRLVREDLDRLFFATVMPLKHAVVSMHVTGLPVAEDKIPVVQQQMTAEIAKLTHDIQSTAGHQFEPGSPEQVSHVLFDLLKLQPLGQRGASGFFSTDKEVLAALEDAHPVIPLVQRYRRVTRLFDMYVQGLSRKLVGSRYYQNFKIHGTVSGRMTEPLIMSLPRGEKGGEIVKGLFVAPPGWSFLFRDLSQIELRVVGHLSQDPIMLDGYRNGGPGFDLHVATAIRMFNIQIPMGEDAAKFVKKHYKPYRSIAKNINFGSLFGASAKRLMTLINQEFPEMACTLQKAEEFLTTYYNTMKGLRALIDSTHATARHSGFVTNMFGRRRRLPDAQIYLPADRSDERPRSGPLRKCFARECPSLTYDLKVEVAEETSMTTDSARARLLAAKNPKYLKPGKERAACVECRLLVPCMYSRERWQRRSRRDDADRQSFSFIVQSSAVDYCNLALMQTLREIERQGLKSRPVLQIHDALGFLVPNEEIEIMARLTKDRMEHAFHMSLPIGSDLTVGVSWGDENLRIPDKCERCDKAFTDRDISYPGEVTVGEQSTYKSVSINCAACGHHWAHDAVFQTTLD